MKKIRKVVLLAKLERKLIKTDRRIMKLSEFKDECNNMINQLKTELAQSAKGV